MFELSTPHTLTELDAVRQLFVDYATSLHVDLCFQNFDAELAALPGDYLAPYGALITAHAGGELVGCCAMRPLDTADYSNACEMKRLFVRPNYRKFGLGRRLAEAILNSARQANYAFMLLDTLSEMGAARGLYEDLRFTEIPPYYDNPIVGTHFLMVRP